MSCENLLIPDVSFVHKDVATSLSYLATINKTNFESHKTKADADGSIPIADLILKASANYDEFDSKRNEVFQQYKFEYSFSDLSSFYESRLSKDAFNAYLACINRYGFVARVEKADAENVTVLIRWNPPPHAPDKVAIIDVNILGGTLLNKMPKNMTHAEEYLLNFSRNPSVRFLFTANVGGTASQVFVPAYREYIKPLQLVAMEAIDVRQGGWCPIIVNAEKRSQVRVSGTWDRHYQSHDIVSGSVGFWLRIVAANGNINEFPNDQLPHMIEVGQSAYYACTDPELSDNDQNWEQWSADKKKYETLFYQGPVRYYLYQ